MPQLVPTTDEIRAMPERLRQRAVRNIRAVLDETDRFIEEHLPSGVVLSPEQRNEARRAVWSVMQVVEEESADKVGQRIRDRARLLERQARKEPDWVTAARVNALLEAIA